MSAAYPSASRQTAASARYLTCERYFIFELLICAGGMLGAYTYNLRGGVFCNAQTANVMLMSLAFGKGEWARGFYYVIPITAYLAGTIVSEILPKPVRKLHFLRWDTWLLAFETVIVFLLGWIPLDAPPQFVQVTINFLTAMQFNTFRQAEGVPMATTFVTNHIRQIGVWLVKHRRHHEPEARKRFRRHTLMVTVFFAGGVLMTICCGVLREKAVWLTLVPLLVSFWILSRADLKQERSRLEEKPGGH